MRTILLSAVAWLALTAAPYVFIGEYWGMVWYLINLPLAEFLKGVLWPVNKVLYVLTVTAANGLVLGTLLHLIILVFKRRHKG